MARSRSRSRSRNRSRNAVRNHYRGGHLSRPNNSAPGARRRGPRGIHLQLATVALCLAACGSSGSTSDDGGVVESRGPGGTLVIPDALEAKVVEVPAPPREGLRPVAAWDVVPRAKTGEPATLAFRFDPASIDPARLSAWSQEPDGSWSMLPVQIDTERGQARVRAEHYSLYAWYVLSDVEFEKYYYSVRLADGVGKRHSSHASTDSGYVRFAIVYRKVGRGAIDEATLVTVEEALRNATKTFYDLGYRAPQTWGFTSDVDVVLDGNTGGAAEPHYSAKPTQGHIYLPIKAAADPAARTARDARLRHDIAHELFHAIEDQYYKWLTMVSELWWVEAAAEYAASQVVGPGHIGELDQAFSPCALDSTDDRHMYASGHFLRWLAAHHGLSLPELLEATANPTSPVILSLDLALDGKLGERLHEFLAWMWFDADFLTSDYAPKDKQTVAASAAAFGQPTSVTFQLRGNGRPVSPQFREVDALEVPGPYGARLWEIQTQVVAPATHRVLEVTIPDGVPSLMEVCLYRVPGDARRPGGITPACMSPGDTRSPVVRVNAGDHLYVLLVNRTAPRSVAIRVGDAVDPTATRVQPLGVGNLALTVPDWLVTTSDRNTALALTSRVAPSFTSIVALPYPGADDAELLDQFQRLMRAVQQPGMVPGHADPRTVYDTVEVLGRTVALRRVTFTATGSWESRVRVVDASGRQGLRAPGRPWTAEIEYQALLWRDGDVGLVLIARGSPADRELLRGILLSLSGAAATRGPCEKNGFCNANAICTPGTDASGGGTPAADGSHTCTCREGFEGDGFNCTAMKPCNQAMLAEWVAMADKSYAQKLEGCKSEPWRSMACAYAIESGRYIAYVNALRVSDCRRYQNRDAEEWQCLDRCAADASICLDKNTPAETCTAPVESCRAACRN